MNASLRLRFQLLFLSFIGIFPVQAQLVHRTFGFEPSLYPPDTTINVHHRDEIGAWFIAPTNGTIDSVFWLTGDSIGGFDSTAYVRIHPSFITPSHGPGVDYPGGTVPWGYLINTNDLDEGIEIFPEAATPTNLSSWTSTIPTGPPTTPPFGMSMWGYNGFAVILHPSQIHGLDLSYEGVIEPLNVTAGQSFFISLQIKHTVDHVMEGATQFRASHTGFTVPTHSWIKFEHDTPHNLTTRGGLWAIDGVGFNIWYTMNVPPDTLNVPLQQGWNLVSLPLDLENNTISSIYPSVQGSAFVYSSGKYVAIDSVSRGTGVWVKSSTSVGNPVMGRPRSLDTIDVQEGWNLIGSVCGPIGPEWIGSIPPGIVTSHFWGFDGVKYNVATTMSPGQGFWVKTNQNGKLILSVTGTSIPPSSRIVIKALSELPPPPPEVPESQPNVQSANSFGLLQNYPNPFNPSTEIRYQIQERSFVRLTIYDLLGRTITTLVQDVQDPGEYRLTWDASAFSSGIFYCELTANGFTETKKLLLLR